MRAPARKVVLGESLGQLLSQVFVQSFKNAVLLEHAFFISEFLVRETKTVMSFGHFGVEDGGLLERIRRVFKAASAECCET